MGISVVGDAVDGETDGVSVGDDDVGAYVGDSDVRVAVGGSEVGCIVGLNVRSGMSRQMFISQWRLQHSSPSQHLISLTLQKLA